MATESTTLLQQVSTLFRVGTLTGMPDGALLDRFRFGPAEEAEAAFAAIVDRHGPMVMLVCRRIVGDLHTAEDAAQATFLVLARQARRIRRLESVASWLYGTATRVAGRARRSAARRRAGERRVAEAAMAIRHVEASGATGEDAWPELYEELGRLPDRFRLPVLLCYLEGLTYEQAARQLGCPVRTVQSRLSRAREKLRVRLARRGVVADSAKLSFAAAFRPDAPATTACSEAWRHATVAAAVEYSAGGTAAALVSGSVAALIKGASRAMILHRLLRWAAAFVVIGGAIGGAVMGTGMGLLARPEPPKPEVKPERPAATINARAEAEPEPEPKAAVENPYRARYKNGATVEVIAVSTVPTGPQTWWQPDGSPLAEPPADAIDLTTHPREGEAARVILVRSTGVQKDDMFRWHPTRTDSYWGGQPTKNGQAVPELEYYVATFRVDQPDCEVRVKLAAGAWKTETSTDGGGATGSFVNGHKFCFGKARAYQAYGRSLTAIAVAHNFLGQDRRLVAVDREGKTYAPISSSGSDGDPRWVLDQIDVEFELTPERIKTYLVQFRPYEEVEIKGIALGPRATTKPAAKTDAGAPRRESAIRPLALGPTGADADTDGDGLSDYQETHKYRTDPAKRSTASDGVPDGDWQRRREFTYSIRSVVKVMPPVNPDCMSDDYQDARVLSTGANFVELELIHYPLNSNAAAIRSNPDWRRDTPSMQESLRPGITTNWDDAMRRELKSALEADGINADSLDDRALVARASAWLMANSKYVSMFCTHYMHYPEGRAAIYPGLEQRFEREKGNPGWTVQEQLDNELFGRSMFVHRTHGSCTSSAVFLTTALRALGIPTRMVLAIPMVDGNDPAQLAMARSGIHHHRLRQLIVQGLSGARGYANHTFNEVFIGGRWVRLNYKTLGQNTVDANLMGMLTHVNTFNDLSEVPLAATWGKRYALGERDEVFRYGNPYRCESVSDHFGKFARFDNPEVAVREHRAITISRAYWADDPNAHDTIKSVKWLAHSDGSRSLLVHGEEWFEDWSGPQYRPFLEAAGKDFVLKADGQPDVHAHTTASSITWHSRGLHEIELGIPRQEYARMEPGVEYTLVPKNDVPGYVWKIKGRVTIAKKR